MSQKTSEKTGVEIVTKLDGNEMTIEAVIAEPVEGQELPNPRQLRTDADEEGYWLDQVTDTEYHADRERVSSSQLRHMAKSPATFLAAYQGVIKVKETQALRFGRLIHQVVLEGGDAVLRQYAVIPAATLRSWGHANSNKHKDAKKAWLAEHAAGKVVVKEAERDQLRAMLEAIAAHPDAALLLREGEPELSGYYNDPETGIRCRIRPDFVNTKINGIIDLKSVVDCDPYSFQRSITDWLYHFQLGMYGAGFEQIEGFAPSFYAFIAVEKTPPYEVAVYAADAEMIHIGQQDYRDCLHKLRQCIDSGSWPAAFPAIQNISLPAWLLKQRS